ncbi:putative efflux pump antibiotic resistance protein [Xylona heveae TC161]|uniref:Putative efflux pump antibiotic resistance protein n=1 Tax=Xylona heveae (strain CBS 132557 / TC161) TaxID=1328760 RepID=A0A164Z8B8_XYLHT|nr:putative efflux pump antibiotic resistance protein [Xylona heveae TC161]KZF18810.1 putative efflux pump antibiotic resistance protein [Xylona heveae TC161]
MEIQPEPVAAAETEKAAADEPQLVTWTSPDDKENPKNWSKVRKWRATVSVSGFVLMNSLSSTIIAPALPQIADSLRVTNDAEQILILSIFVLGFAFGPFLACPLSEIHGRIRIIQSWNFLYLIFNTVCGPVNSAGAMLALRFMAGFFCSASQGIGSGVLSDLFTTKERGRAIAVYSIMPLIGPVIGPVLGGVIAQHTTWRWTFYTASLLDAIILIPSFFTLEETFTPVLLRHKKRRLEKETGQRYFTEYDHLDQAGAEVYKLAIIRPIKLLATQPIIQVMAVYNSFLYGLIYILYANFPSLWTDIYHETPEISGVNYLSLFVGSLFAAELCTHAIDHIQRHLSAKHNGAHFPEFRMPIMPPATIVLAAGMFLYGWSAEYKTHWIVPNIGAAIFMGAAMACAIAVNMYMIDTYGKFAASALAAINMLRQMFGCFFPIFAPSLYEKLGYGWGNSILGFIALGIGLPAVVMLWKFGHALRRRSPYAQDRND